MESGFCFLGEGFSAGELSGKLDSGNGDACMGNCVRWWWEIDDFLKWHRRYLLLCHRRTTKEACWCWEVMVATLIERLLRYLVLCLKCWVFGHSFILSSVPRHFFFWIPKFFLFVPDCTFLLIQCGVQIIIKIAAGNGVGKILIGKWVSKFEFKFWICLAWQYII